VPLRTQTLYLNHLMNDSTLGVFDEKISFHFPLYLGASFRGHTS
jgi:hypothetical protein